MIVSKISGFVFGLFIGWLITGCEITFEVDSSGIDNMLEQYNFETAHSDAGLGQETFIPSDYTCEEACMRLRELDCNGQDGQYSYTCEETCELLIEHQAVNLDCVLEAEECSTIAVDCRLF
jgi:hypothetical protein